MVSIDLPLKLLSDQDLSDYEWSFHDEQATKYQEDEYLPSLPFSSEGPPAIKYLRPLSQQFSSQFSSHNNGIFTRVKELSDVGKLRIQSMPTMLPSLESDRPLHFLIVDDSAMVRKLTSQVVKSFAHTFTEAIDGEDAVNKVRSADSISCFDVILMDNQMPKMMGVEATRIIRQELGFPGLIFGVTGNALDEDLRAFVRNGANEVLIKPLTKDKFHEYILCFNHRHRRASEGYRSSRGGRSSDGSRRSRENSIYPFNSYDSSDSEVQWPMESIAEQDPFNILIVDDSALVRRITSQLVRSMRHTAVEAVDGEDAVDTIRRAVRDGIIFDVILMDNQMPKMMGVEATRIIRQELGFPGLIFGVTGNVIDDDMNAFIKNGANEVLIKPLTREKFTGHVLGYRDKFRGRRSSDRSGRRKSSSSSSAARRVSLLYSDNNISES